MGSLVWIHQSLVENPFTPRPAKEIRAEHVRVISKPDWNGKVNCMPAFHTL
jgi:hypothetical protein